MRSKYSASMDISVPNDRGSLAAFFTWSKISDQEKNHIISYFRSRFDKGAAEVADFVAWLFPGDVAHDNPAALIERVFPVEELQALTSNLEQQVELTEVQRAALNRFRDLCPARPPETSLPV